MIIDTPLLAIIITVLITLLGMAVAWGSLGQRVNEHDKMLERLHSENRQDHQQIFNKLDEINQFMRNGNEQP